MYSRCLFCDAPFGRNDDIEHLLTGRRIAFDAGRGRLWVICRDCGRWNLTPLEDRWEAIEECERTFRSTRIRSFSEQIGLACCPGGLVLIRIGRPERGEFAAWRYGHQLQRRHQRRIGHALAQYGGYAMIAGGPALALAFGPFAPLAYAGAAAIAAAHLWHRPAARIPLQDHGELRLNLRDLQGVSLSHDSSAPDGWIISLPHRAETERLRRIAVRGNYPAGEVILTGRAGRLAATIVLPHVNPLGGNLATVSDAVGWLDAMGGPGQAFETVARSPRVRPALAAGSRTLVTMHTEVRLALEMALHEEEERRALAGELSVLEWAWRREEGLAEVADGLGRSEQIERQLAALGRRAL